MVDFHPFPGFRPVLNDGEKIVERISPPYDVIGEKYLNELQSFPFNVTRLTLMPEEGRYHKASAEISQWIDGGMLAADERPCYYLYRQTFDGGLGTMTRTGLVGILRTETYDEGNIIPHEETFSKVKEDRLNLLRDTDTHCESIFGIFEGMPSNVSARMGQLAVPVYSHQDRDGVLHEFLRIDDASLVDDISKNLSKQKMLIADGHHRFETALAFSQENPGNESRSYVLATLVSADDPGLVIWPTHRLVNVDGFDEDAFVDDLKLTFKEAVPVKVEDLEKELPSYDMAILLRSGAAFLLTYEDDSDPMWSLDTYIAQEKILKGMLGYDDGKAKVSFDAEIGSVLVKMADNDHDMAILFNPPSLDKVWDLSLKGKRMPKKSTYFFPKIWSGFVYYRMG